MWYIIFLSQASSYSLESESDGEFVGWWTFSLSLALLLLIFTTFLISKKKPSISGLTNIIMLFEFSRWGVLLDYSSTPFYIGFWKILNNFFDPFEVIGSSEDPPNNERLKKMGVESSIFLYNAEEQLAVLIVCLIAFCIIWFFIKSYKELLLHYSLLGWAFEVLVLDLVFFSFLQFDYINSSDFLNFIGSVVSFVVLASSAIIIFMIFSGIGKKDEKFMKYFSEEFKLEKPYTHYIYHPLLHISRVIIAIAHVFTLEYPDLHYSIIIVIEAAILAFLVITIPFSAFRNTLFCLIYHCLEILLISLPLLYEGDELEDKTSNALLIIFTWTGIGLGCIRFFLDLIFSEKPRIERGNITEESVQEKDKTFDPVVSVLPIKEEQPVLEPEEPVLAMKKPTEENTAEEKTVQITTSVRRPPSKELQMLRNHTPPRDVNEIRNPSEGNNGVKRGSLISSLASEENEPIRVRNTLPKSTNVVSTRPPRPPVRAFEEEDSVGTPARLLDVKRSTSSTTKTIENINNITVSRRS